MKHPVCIQYYDSPCGKLTLASVDNMLCLCDWHGMPCAERNTRRLTRLLHAEFWEEPSDVIRCAQEQLEEYFAGRRQTFTVPLRMVGTPFQKRVWEALLEVSYGETRTYKKIAQRVGNPLGIRAVAQAIGANGISIFVPCHRIIGANNSLTGFAGGLPAKQLLLGLEQRDSTLIGKLEYTNRETRVH